MEAISQETIKPEGILLPEETTSPEKQLSEIDFKSLPDTGSPIDNSPDGSILELAAELSKKHWLGENDVVAYEKGEVKLHALTKDTLLDLIGLDNKGELAFTGLRFLDKMSPENISTSSEPNFSAGNSLPTDVNLDKRTEGKVHVTVKDTEDKENKYIFTIVIDGFNVGDTGNTMNEIFNVTLIPDANSTIEDCHNYYKMLAENLKNPEQPDFMI